VDINGIYVLAKHHPLKVTKLDFRGDLAIFENTKSSMHVIRIHVDVFYGPSV
jgi:hypothetical protein